MTDSAKFAKLIDQAAKVYAQGCKDEIVRTAFGDGLPRRLHAHDQVDGRGHEEEARTDCDMNSNNATTRVTLADIYSAMREVYMLPGELRAVRAIRAGARPSVAQAKFRFWMWRTWNAAAEGKPLPAFPCPAQGDVAT